MPKSAKHDGSHGAYVTGSAFELHIITVGVWNVLSSYPDLCWGRDINTHGFRLLQANSQADLVAENAQPVCLLLDVLSGVGQ